MAPILDDYGAASATDEDLARRKARDAVHSKWDSHPEVTKKPSVRDMENELPEGMKFVDNESNATEREEAEYWIGHNQKSALKKERHVIETTREANDRADERVGCATADARVAAACAYRARGLALKRAKDRPAARLLLWRADWLLRDDVPCDPPREAARHWHEAEKLREEGLGHEDGDEAWDDVWADCGDADLRALRWVLRGNLHCDAAACAIESGHWRAALSEASWVLDDSRKAAAGRLNRWTASYRCAQAHRGLGDSEARWRASALPTDAGRRARRARSRAAARQAALVVDERKLAGIGRALLHGIAEGKSLYARTSSAPAAAAAQEGRTRARRERAARGEEEEDPGPRSASSRSSTAAAHRAVHRDRMDREMDETCSLETARRLMTLHRDGAPIEQLRAEYEEMDKNERHGMLPMMNDDERAELAEWSTKLNNALRAENESKGDKKLVQRREEIYLEYRKRYVRVRSDIEVREKLKGMDEGTAAAWREADRLERDEGKMPQDVQEAPRRTTWPEDDIEKLFYNADYRDKTFAELPPRDGGDAAPAVDDDGYAEATGEGAAEPSKATSASRAARPSSKRPDDDADAAPPEPPESPDVAIAKLRGADLPDKSIAAYIGDLLGLDDAKAAAARRRREYARLKFPSPDKAPDKESVELYFVALADAIDAARQRREAGHDEARVVRELVDRMKFNVDHPPDRAPLAEPTIPEPDRRSKLPAGQKYDGDPLSEADVRFMVECVRIRESDAEDDGRLRARVMQHMQAHGTAFLEHMEHTANLITLFREMGVGPDERTERLIIHYRCDEWTG
ncbi:hypothetical protein JL720_9985 [Aureococcus anophagefferens]|nr:hypothetical protein JL720_9985 [Aureococcus anophagefferens]